MLNTILFLTISLLAVIFLEQIIKYIYISLNVGERLAISSFIWLLEINTLSFVFALLEIYSLNLILFILVIQIIIEVLFLFKKQCFNIAFLKEYLKLFNNKIMCIILFTAIILYSAFPTYYLWARRDPALYLINGVNIAENSGIQLQSNDYLNENYEEIQDFAELTYRGIYSDYEHGDSQNPGDITSQFLHFFSSLLAIGYSLAGMDGLVRVNSVVGVFCIIAIYYFVKRFFNQRTALIAALLLAINPAQIWTARITQTELLYQLWLIWGCYLYASGWKNQSAKFALGSGLILGFIGLNRIDSYILGLGIFAVSIYYNIFYKDYSSYGIFAAIGYTISSVLTFIYTVVFSPYYFEEHWNEGSLRAIIILNLGMLLIAIATYICRKSLHHLCSSRNIFAYLANDRKARIWICITFLLGFWIMYFIRPLFQNGLNADGAFNQRAVVEFCWYSSVLAIPFFLFGLWKITCNYKMRHQLLLYLGIGLSGLIIYLYRPAVAPDHLWASRRWVSCSLPFVLIIASYGIEQVSSIVIKTHPYTKYMHLLAVLLIGGFFIYQSRLFLFTPMLSELPKAYSELLDSLDDDTVYFADQPHFASILRFVYGKNVFVLKENSQHAIRRYLETTGETFYYLGNPSKDFTEELTFTKLADHSVKGTYIDQTAGSYPTKLTTTGAEVDLYGVSIPGEINPIYREILANKQQNVLDKTVQNQQKNVSNYTYYGPYISLPRANYIVSWELQYVSGSGLLGYCDISVNNGTTVVQSVELTQDMFQNGTVTVTIPFSLYSNTAGIEFRVYTYEGTELELVNLYYKQTLNSFTPGLDNPSETTALVKDLQDVGLASSLVYLNSTQDDIDISYLQSLIPDCNMSVLNAGNMDMLIKAPSYHSCYVLADKAYFDWFRLLPEYTVIKQYENHILLVSSSAITEDILRLSWDNYADLSLIQKQQDNLYVSGSYALKEGGEYEVVLDIPQNIDDTDSIHVKVYSGSTVIEELMDLEYGNSISIPFTTYSGTNDLSFLLYSEKESKQIICNSGRIRQIRSGLSYTYDEQLRPLLDIAEELPFKDNTLAFLSPRWEKESIDDISAYLDEQTIEFFQYQPDDIEDGILFGICSTTAFPTQEYLIATPDLAMLYDVLSQYIIAGRTDRYVLLVDKDYTDILYSLGIASLSRDLTISSSFFKKIDDTGVAKWDISIPSGTYEIIFETDTDTISSLHQAEDEIAQLQIWSGNNLYDSFHISQSDAAIVVSSQYGIENLSFKFLTNTAGTIPGKFAGIKKISDGYQIRLNTLISLSQNAVYDENARSLTTSNDTIYGPYLTMEAGEYEAIFEYTTDHPAGVYFDVACNQGEEISSSAYVPAKRDGENYLMKLPFTLSDTTNNMEFRMYVSDTVEATLTNLSINPID